MYDVGLEFDPVGAEEGVGYEVRDVHRSALEADDEGVGGDQRFEGVEGGDDGFGGEGGGEGDAGCYLCLGGHDVLD